MEEHEFKNADYEELFRNRWKWQSENPLEDLDEWPDSYILEGVRCIPCHINNLIEKTEDQRLCDNCPVEWGTEHKAVDCFCIVNGSPYLEWQKARYNAEKFNNAFNSARLAWIASTISMLSWKCSDDKLKGVK